MYEFDMEAEVNHPGEDIHKKCFEAYYALKDQDISDFEFVFGVRKYKQAARYAKYLRNDHLYGAEEDKPLPEYLLFCGKKVNYYLCVQPGYMGIVRRPR